MKKLFSLLLFIFLKSDGGFLLTTDGSNIPISRNRKEEVIQKLKK
ncbi:MAG: hypothetical protein ACERKD_20960 [Prolixibacteraceae bacterium]